MTQTTFRAIKALSYIVFSSICSITLIFSGVTLALLPNLPPVSEIQDIQLQVPLKIFTQDGKLIAEYGEKHRSPIAYHEIPTNFTNALISAEDNRFWEHQGVDLVGLARAAFQLATSGSIKSGGSTITMQVAKNYFLSREKTFSRKFNEILLALQLEKSLSKEQILELYLNKIYLGHRSYGIAAAARTYYGKNVHDLTLAQTAMIAGLPKAPSAYNPLRNPERAIERRNWILDRMQALGYISQSDKNTAQQSPVTAKYHSPKSEIDAFYAADMARTEAIERFPDDIYTGGYKIFTTIDSNHQTAALNSIATHLENYSKRHGFLGPEDNVNLEQVLNDTNKPLEISELTKFLKKYRQINQLVPALTWEVTDQQASLITKDGTLINIPKKNLTWAREHISANQKGKRIRKATDVLKQGDIVRVYQDDDQQWKLGQIPQAQAALVSINPNNGAISALQGGFEFYNSKFNRVTSARRQAGSAIKPFIYYSALEDGFTAASIINDAPVVFQDQQLETSWRPENAGGKFYGPTRLRQALYQSRNLISIRIVQTLGIQQTINTIKKFGFPEEHLPQDLSIALGSAAITPMELATAYSTIANGGQKVTPYIIEHIEDFDGNIVYQNPYAKTNTATNNPELLSKTTEDHQADALQTDADSSNIKTASNKPKQANSDIDPRSIYIITDMMKDVVKLGTARKAKELDRNDIAGKTGTTNDQVDAWFSGFNSDMVTTVWVGFDKPSTLGRNEYGGRAALPIWMDYMKEALPPYESTMQQPENIVTIRINPTTGHRALPGEKNAIFEIFRSEHVPPPPEEDNARPVLIDQGHPTDVLDELF